MMDITVERGTGDAYAVRVGRRTSHTVRATPAALARVTRPGEAAEDALVRAFRFLLEREPPESILPSFELEDIGRYFPEFWSHMTRG